MVEISQKWGFGMAPPKPTTLAQREAAVRSVLKLMDGMVEPGTLDSMSVVKGMFNRVWRQDQWDWFTVYAALGYPSGALCRIIGFDLAEIRKNISDIEPPSVSEIERNRLRVCLETYLGDRIIVDEPGAGWVYLLSTREFPDLVKVGMTTRSVQDRVREINSATGVPIPFGVRGCWRVTDPQRAERTVHEALDSWRFRSDREFFKISYGIASKQITNTLRENGLELRVSRLPDSSKK
jgi:hypothetical protein